MAEWNTDASVKATTQQRLTTEKEQAILSINQWSRLPSSMEGSFMDALPAILEAALPRLTHRIFPLQGDIRHDPKGKAAPPNIFVDAHLSLLRTGRQLLPECCAMINERGNHTLRTFPSTYQHRVGHSIASYDLVSIILYDGSHFNTLMLVSGQSPQAHFFPLNGTSFLPNGIWSHDALACPDYSLAGDSTKMAQNLRNNRSDILPVDKSTMGNLFSKSNPFKPVCWVYVHTRNSVSRSTAVCPVQAAALKYSNDRPSSSDAQPISLI